MIFLSDGHDIISYGARYKNIKEHELILKFNNLIEDYFKISGVPYIRVNADYRCVDESFKISSKVLSLKYKVNYINQLVKYFKNPLAIETHFNYYDGKDNNKGCGYEVLYYSHSEISKKLALLLLKNVRDFDIMTHLIDRGVKAREDLYFLKGTICPALIIEPFFLDDDIHYYTDIKMFEMLAVAWAHSIEKIYKGGVLR